MSHRKSKEYYSKLYDQHTVEECRHTEARHVDLDPSSDDYPKMEKYKELDYKEYMVLWLSLYFTAGERYLNKAETIQKWIRRDKQKDKKLKESEPPNNITCDTCGEAMTNTDKELDNTSNPEIMFFFECPNGHVPHKFVYADGTTRTKDSRSCPDCGADLKENSTREDEVITTEYNCSKCDYTDEMTLDLNTSDDDEDPNFEHDRERFCLDKEVGERYRKSRQNLIDFHELAEEMEDKRKHEEEVKRAEKIERLTVPNIKDRMRNFFEGRDLQAISFEDLNVNPRATYMPFSVEDPEANQDNNRECRLKLKKEIVAELEDANWRLMSDGISYKLGIMSGCLRVYESDDDIYNLVKRESNQ